jgi:hypothetical protein
MNPIDKIANLYSEARFKKIGIKKGFTSDNSILLFCDPRGGSTWLSEILIRNLSVALVWEPLHLNHNTDFKKIGFYYRQHIPENAHWDEAKKLFDLTISGKNLNKWTTSKTSLEDLKNADKLMTKFCRGHLLLPWMVQNFDLKHQPIHFIRHPLAVLASMLRHQDWDGLNYESYPIPTGRYTEIYDRHRDFLKNIHLREDVLLATWCICNQYLLNHEWANKRWITVTYENLLLNPEHELARIRTRWGDKKEWDISDVNIPSSTTQKGSPFHAKDRLSYWNKHFNEDQLNQFDRILKYFQVDLYNLESLPTYTFD